MVALFTIGIIINYGCSSTEEEDKISITPTGIYSVHNGKYYQMV